ncbi:MAG TPA: hypothetical protein PKA76_19685, partial [Pirellulaceae bacterium]|nr:hypothetical protein [Pirellulaceae bacterium]
MNEAVTNEREPTLCPICGVDRATSDGCEHLAHVRFDDIDFTEVSFVFCSSDDEVGYTFDELYLAVL